jgi:hypothetical protein
MSEQTEKTNAFEMASTWLATTVKEYGAERSAQWLVDSIREHASDGASKKWIGELVHDTLELYDQAAVSWIAPFATRAAGRLKTHSFRLDVVEARVVELGERKQIDRGPPGPMGPMPKHEWSGTKLRFEQGPDGNHWGAWTDLRGPPGPGAKEPLWRGGGAPIIAAPQNAYFPAGW